MSDKDTQSASEEGGGAPPLPSGGEGGEDSGAEFDFSQLDSLFEDDGDGEAEAPPADDSSEEESAGAPGQQGASEEEGSEESSTEQGSEETSEEQQAGSEEEASTSEEQAGEEQAAGEEEQGQQLSDEEYQRRMKEAWDQAVSELTNSPEFQITEEEADQILTEPSKVLPQVMARTSLRMFQDTIRQLNASIPSQVDRAINQRESAQQHEQKFLGNYPELKGNMQTVRNVAKAVSQAGGFETQEEFERLVAAQSFIKLGKQLPARFYEGAGQEGGQQGGEEGPPPARPESESKPHRPAGAGQPDGPTAPGQGQPQRSFWERLNEELDQEEEEI